MWERLHRSASRQFAVAALIFAPMPQNISRFWATHKGLRAGLAIVAAYAVALQMLLASIAPGHLLSGVVNSAADFIICQHDSDAPSGNPAPSHHQDHCPPCVLSLLASTLLVRPGSSWLIPTTLTSPIPARTTPALVAARHPTPRLSQGPPDRA